MKLQLHFPQTFHFGHTFSKTIVLSNYELEILKSNNKTSLKKIKTDLNKLSPLHWYDGIWNDLDYKM